MVLFAQTTDHCEIKTKVKNKLCTFVDQGEKITAIQEGEDVYTEEVHPLQKLKEIRKLIL